MADVITKIKMDETSLKSSVALGGSKVESRWKLKRKPLVKKLILSLFFLFLLAPIYWLLVMSFKTDTEIVTGLTLWPQDFTLANYTMT